MKEEVDRLTNRPRDGQTYRYTVRQTDRQTDIKTKI